MITRLVWTAWTLMSAVSPKPLNLITHSALTPFPIPPLAVLLLWCRWLRRLDHSHQLDRELHCEWDYVHSSSTPHLLHDDWGGQLPQRPQWHQPRGWWWLHAVRLDQRHQYSGKHTTLGIGLSQWEEVLPEYGLSQWEEALPGHGLSQREDALLCNVSSHWLSPYLEWPLLYNSKSIA